MSTLSVIAEARLRARNQITLPDLVVQAGALAEGERFVVEIDPSDPDMIRLHRIRPSYAGALHALFPDASAALAEVRQGWE